MGLKRTYTDYNGSLRYYNGDRDLCPKRTIKVGAAHLTTIESTNKESLRAYRIRKEAQNLLELLKQGKEPPESGLLYRLTHVHAFEVFPNSQKRVIFEQEGNKVECIGIQYYSFIDDSIPDPISDSTQDYLIKPAQKP